MGNDDTGRFLVLKKDFIVKLKAGVPKQTMGLSLALVVENMADILARQQLELESLVKSHAKGLEAFKTHNPQLKMDV